jgi:hypothetical protein
VGRKGLRSMKFEVEHGDLKIRLDEAEGKLKAIGDLAAAPVAGGPTAEDKLADAERRLNYIYDLVTSEHA